MSTGIIYLFIYTYSHLFLKTTGCGDSHSMTRLTFRLQLIALIFRFCGALGVLRVGISPVYVSVCQATFAVSKLQPCV